MVGFVYVLIFLFLNNPVLSQILNDDSIQKLGGVPDCLPVYKGGETSLNLFIENSILYPAQAKKDSIEGVVFVHFKVDTAGITMDHEILKGIRKDLDKEAIRVAKLINFEKPAMIRGKPIKSGYILKIEFKITDEMKIKKKSQN